MKDVFKTVLPEIVIDLETLSTEPEGAIIAIGAVAFNFEHTLMRGIYCVIDMNDSIESGGVIDDSTMKWWSEQSEEARAIFTDPERVSLKEGMQKLFDFVVAIRKQNIANGNEDRLTLWGNDNSFDIVLCERSFKRLNILCPWKYWEGASVRTLVDLGRRFGIDPKKSIKRKGVHHNAIDDCLHEIRYCRAIIKHFDFVHKQAEYYKKLALAARKFINYSPCNPDFPEEQVSAHLEYMDLLEEGKGKPWSVDP